MGGNGVRTSRRRAALLGIPVAAAVAGSLALGSLARAQTVDRSGEATPDAPFAWQGDVASGLDESSDPAACSKEVATYCDITLVNVVPGDFYETAGGGVEFSTDGAPRSKTSICSSSRATPPGRSAISPVRRPASLARRAGVDRRRPGLLPVSWPFTSPRHELGLRRHGRVLPAQAVPPDIDDPPGDPGLPRQRPGPRFPVAFRAPYRAEPANPNLLVGGLEGCTTATATHWPNTSSRSVPMCPSTADATWPDLGQLDVCPREQAPPESCPLDNTCYPDDDPNLGGRAPRTPVTPADRATSARSTSPLTSWVDFDERAPPTRWCSTRPSRSHRNGWGRASIAGTPRRGTTSAAARTWSDRIPINAYDDPRRTGGDARRQEHLCRE